MLSNRTIIFILLALPAPLFAAGGHHGEFPWDKFVYQCINVTILFSILFYFGRKPISATFKQRRENFFAAANKAQAVRAAAEAENADIKSRLQKLESTAQDSIIRAKAEAANLRDSILTEAKEVSGRIANEAKESAKIEISRAKTSLRRQLIKDSYQSARVALEQVSADDHQRLQGQFIDSMQVVQR